MFVCLFTCFSISESVCFFIPAGSDYLMLGTELTFLDGVQFQTFTVVIISDTVIEPVETILVNKSKGSKSLSPYRKKIKSRFP